MMNSRIIQNQYCCFYQRISKSMNRINDKLGVNGSLFSKHLKGIITQRGKAKYI